MERIVPKNKHDYAIKTNVLTKRSERLNFLWGFIGTNRTGKSTVACRLAETWKESRPNGTIMTFDPQRKFESVTDFPIEPGDDNWAFECMKLRDALIILDDYRLINRPNVSVPGFLELMHYRSEYNIDIIFICHNPKLVINDLTYYATHYTLFYTQAKEGSFESKIPNYQMVLSASQLVNKYVTMHGRGDYPDFPYVVVDTEKEKIEAYNMSKPMDLKDNKKK